MKVLDPKVFQVFCPCGTRPLSRWRAWEPSGSEPPVVLHLPKSSQQTWVHHLCSAQDKPRASHTPHNREHITILIIIPNSKCCRSARHECPSVTSYLFSPQTARFQISHIQCNLKEITGNNPAHQCFSTTRTALLLGYNQLWEVQHVIFFCPIIVVKNTVSGVTKT